MSSIATQAAQLIEALPEEDKVLAYEFIKKLVIAWDPDFTKVTVEEAKRIDEAEKSGFVDDAEIDWGSIGTDE